MASFAGSRGYLWRELHMPELKIVKHFDLHDLESERVLLRVLEAVTDPDFVLMYRDLVPPAQA